LYAFKVCLHLFQLIYLGFHVTDDFWTGKVLPIDDSVCEPFVWIIDFLDILGIFLDLLGFLK
jgi:hypothetical protein